ncbi:MAG TPA: hypothetical protein VHM28_07140 [Anaerolineales bacterium]|jgi:plastocyanin|nr:hypothetical protein [Anaerolineales bacterium]
MKRYLTASFLLTAALLLSSCSMHLGLSKVFNPNSAQSTKPKHIKATHTPPSPPSATPSANQSATPTPAVVNEVAITSTGFTPSAIQVKVGTTVTWTNNDTSTEAFTSDIDGLDSGPLEQGGMFVYTFTEAGTFVYHSTSDSTLVGTVIVSP